MATLLIDNIAYGEIEFRRRNFPTGKFLVKSGVTVSEGDLIDIIANYTSTGSTVSTTIFKGRVINRDFEKVKTITTEAEAEELEKVRPQARYSGTLGGLIQDLERDWFNYLSLSLSATSPYMYRSYHNFKGVTVGQMPPMEQTPYGWSSNGSGTYHVYVIASTLGHQKPLELYSNTAGGWASALYEWAFEKSVNKCNMDIWVATNSTTKQFTVHFKNFYHSPTYDGIVLKFENDGKIYYRTGSNPDTFTDSGQTYAANTIYRLTLYADGGTDKWSLDINDVNILSDIAIIGDINTYYLEGVRVDLGTGYTNHYVWIDAPGFDQTLIDYEQNYTLGTNKYYEYDELNYDTDYMKYVLGGDMTLRQFFDMYADNYLYVWYLKPDYELIFNTGAVDSGVDLSASSNVKNIDGKKQIKNFDKVVLLGGFVNNQQLEAISGAGNVIVQDTYADITNYDTLLALAGQILTQKAGNPISVALDYLNLTEGYIQVGEELTIIGNVFRFKRSDEYICTSDTQFKIKGCKVYIADGQIIRIELFLDDVLVFKIRGVEVDLPKQNSALISQVGTGTSQTGTPPSQGEANTMSNIGVAGVGIYKLKSGVQFQMKNINAGSSKITITDDTGNDEIDIDVVMAEIKAGIEALGLALASTKVITSADEDLIFTFGRMKAGPLWSDSMCISHRDQYATASYALRQLQAGETSINAKSGQSIILRNNGLTKVTVNSAGLTMNAPIAMGSNKITGLAAATVNGDAVRYEQLHAENHVLATSGPHSNTLPVTDIANGTEGYRLRAGASNPVWAETISDNAFDVNWNGVQDIGASKDALYDVINPLVAGVTYAGTWNPTSPDGLFPGNLESGTNGVTTAASVNFSSTGALFQTAGVAPGDILLLEDGNDEAYRVIATVPTETTLTVTGSNFTGDTAIIYQVFSGLSGGDYYITIADGECYNQFYENGDWIIWNSTTIAWDRIRSYKGDNFISVSPGDNIQVAIDEIEAVGSGTIFLEPGTHTLSATLTINSVSVDITVRGAYNASIIDSGDRTALIVSNAESCVLEAFKIDASDLTMGVTDIIEIAEASDNKIIAKDLNIVGNGDKYGRGIYLTSNNIEIISCVFNQLQRGIFASSADNAIILENQILNCSGYGIISESDSAVIMGNICNNNNYGISIINAAINNIISNNSCDGNTNAGIELNNTDYNIVSNNQCINTTSGCGVYIVSDSDENIIIGNVLGGNSTYGINIDSVDCNNNIIGSNKFYSNPSGDIRNVGTGTILFGDDTAYGAGWNGDLGTPTKNVVYDKLETYDTLPIGFIAMFSGSWLDNSTIPGWYACTAANLIAVGTVDLEGKFVRGGANSGGTGGSDDAVVVEHGHTSVDKTHTHTVGNQLTSHSHSLTLNYHSIYNGSYAEGGTHTSVSGSKNTDTQSASHKHAVTGGSHNHTINNEGVSGTGKNIPAYYTLIFIQKIS